MGDEWTVLAWHVLKYRILSLLFLWDKYISLRLSLRQHVCTDTAQPFILLGFAPPQGCTWEGECWHSHTRIYRCLAPLYLWKFSLASGKKSCFLNGPPTPFIQCCYPLISFFCVSSLIYSLIKGKKTQFSILCLIRWLSWMLNTKRLTYFGFGIGGRKKYKLLREWMIVDIILPHLQRLL